METDGFGLQRAEVAAMWILCGRRARRTSQALTVKQLPESQTSRQFAALTLGAGSQCMSLSRAVFTRPSQDKFPFMVIHKIIAASVKTHSVGQPL